MESLPSIPHLSPQTAPHLLHGGGGQGRGSCCREGGRSRVELVGWGREGEDLRGEEADQGFGFRSGRRRVEGEGELGGRVQNGASSGVESHRVGRFPPESEQD